MGCLTTEHTEYTEKWADLFLARCLAVLLRKGVKIDELV